MKRIICTLVLLCLLPVHASAVELDIGGKSALLMDVATGTVLYESNSHEQLAPASVTKVMTMLLIMEAVDSGKIRMEDTVTASEAAAAKGGSQIFLKVGETMSVSDMLKSIAVSSANDIALMSRELMKNHPNIKQFTTIWMDTVRNGAFGLSNTNKLIRFYSGATGLKTGFTSGAGYCLSATAEREGMELIAVVMGCATSQERTAACKAMLDYGFAKFALVSPELTEHNTAVAVKLGKETSVSAILGGDTGMLIDKGKKSAVTTEVTLVDTVTAPVEKGQSLGTMTVKAGDQILAEVPLVAAEDVARLTWGDLFVKVLRRVAMARG